MALTRNYFEAEDLVQETYVRAIEAMGRLREHSNVKAWLYTILRNIRLNQVRQRRTRPKLVELDAHENRSEEHTSELQSPDHLVCRLLLEKKKQLITNASD